MKICFASSECVPYVKTGGLADVSGALPKALSHEGCQVKIFLPLYKSISTLDYKLRHLSEFADIPVHIGPDVRTFNIWYGMLPGADVEVYFIDCPYYFHRESIYTDDRDEDERYILFQNAVLLTLQRIEWAPDIMHCNDWQTSLIPVYLKTNFKWDKLFENTTTLLSIHNIGYQGRFSKSSVGNAGLDINLFYPGGPFEIDSSFSFLKAGILFSEIISTVSPTYAKEIQTKEYGAGLEGVLATRKDDLYGILNGIDTDVWNPAKDKFLKEPYSAETLELKNVNKRYLFDRIEMPYEEGSPAIGIVTRLTGQKGIDLLRPIIFDFMSQPVQFVTLGSGEKQYENFFKEMHILYPDKFYSYIGYSNELSHLVTAGCDMFLMPSKYEPCGLNQMYSLNYGTVPIVRKTGGLADTVKDYHEHNEEGNGFSFEDYSPSALRDTIFRAMEMFKDKKVWESIMRKGMAEDFSWKKSALEYIGLYEKAAAYHK
jgi:starch synthase